VKDLYTSGSYVHSRDKRAVDIRLVQVLDEVSCTRLAQVDVWMQKVYHTKRSKSKQRRIKLKHEPSFFFRLVQGIPKIIIPFVWLLFQFLIGLNRNIGTVDARQQILRLPHGVSNGQKRDQQANRGAGSALTLSIKHFKPWIWCR
jgi:hypothetical protein